MRLGTRLAVAWLSNVAALWVAGRLLDGVDVDGFPALALAAIVLGIVNALVKPVVVALSFPAILLTLGLFLFVINVAMLALTDWLVGGFDIHGFWSYAGAVIVVWFVNSAVEAAARSR